MIEYSTDLDGLTADELAGFFVGWPAPPSPDRRPARRVLAGLDTYGVDLCCDDDVVPCYDRLGFHRLNGMVLRRR